MPLQAHYKRARGVTLLELVLAVGMMAVVVAVMAPILHGVQGSWAAREGNSETLAHARAFMHHIHQQLSQAVRVTDVSDSSTLDGHIQFIDYNDVEARYEIDGADDIQFGPLGSLTDVAGPVDAMRFICYDGNDFGTPTTGADSIRFITVEATFRNPNSSGHSHTLSTSAYMRTGAIEEEAVALDPGIAAKDAVTWLATQIDSYHSSQGDYDPDDASEEANTSVNDTADDSIIVGAWATLHGRAWCGPGGDPEQAISTEWWGLPGSITGEPPALAMDEAVSIPDVSAHPGGHWRGSLIKSSGMWPILSGRYSEIRLTGSAKGTVSGTVTAVLDNKLEVSGSARIDIPASSSLSLWIKGPTDGSSTAVLIQNEALVNASSDSAKDPSKLQIYVTGTNRTMTVRGDDDGSKVYAVIQNPKGAVSIGGLGASNTSFFGKIKAKSVTGVGGQVHVDLDAQFE